MPSFCSASYRNVSRSYAEFVKFADALAGNNPQSVVPALPLAQTCAATDDEDDRLVKLSIQRWISRVTSDPMLVRDDELRSFVESDFGVSQPSCCLTIAAHVLLAVHTRDQAQASSRVVFWLLEIIFEGL